MPARYFKWSYDMKKIILMLCLLAVSVTMYGCTSKEIHKDSGLMKITDDNGRQVAFSKKSVVLRTPIIWLDDEKPDARPPPLEF